MVLKYNHQLNAEQVFTVAIFPYNAAEMTEQVSYCERSGCSAHKGQSNTKRIEILPLILT